jgi:hypothetical protein
MELTRERINELGMIILLDKMERDGLHLNPKEIKRDLANNAKKHKIPVEELAQFLKYVTEVMFNRVNRELDELILNKKG